MPVDDDRGERAWRAGNGGIQPGRDRRAAPGARRTTGRRVDDHVAEDAAPSGARDATSRETCPICGRPFERPGHLRTPLHVRHRKSEIIRDYLEGVSR